jgi:hypothetical protein
VRRTSILSFPYFVSLELQYSDLHLKHLKEFEYCNNPNVFIYNEYIVIGEEEATFRVVNMKTDEILTFTPEDAGWIYLFEQHGEEMLFSCLNNVYLYNFHGRSYRIFTICKEIVSGMRSVGDYVFISYMNNPTLPSSCIDQYDLNGKLITTKYFEFHNKILLNMIFQENRMYFLFDSQFGFSSPDVYFVGFDQKAILEGICVPSGQYIENMISHDRGICILTSDEILIYDEYGTISTLKRKSSETLISSFSSNMYIFSPENLEIYTFKPKIEHLNMKSFTDVTIVNNEN